jgi:hypothetical protein
LGDGFDKVDLFVDAIRKLMLDDEKCQAIGEQAIQYIKDRHSVESFQENMRTTVLRALK